MSVQEVSYDHAIELANAERYDEALVILDQLSQAQPQVVDFDCLRARLHYDRGDAQQELSPCSTPALAKLPGLPLHPAHRWSSRGVIAHRYGMLLLGMGTALGRRCPWLEEAALRNGLSSGEWSARLHAGLAHYRLGISPGLALIGTTCCTRRSRPGRRWYPGPGGGLRERAAGERGRADAAPVPGARIGLDNPELLELDEDRGATPWPPNRRESCWPASRTTRKPAASVPRCATGPASWTAPGTTSPPTSARRRTRRRRCANWNGATSPVKPSRGCASLSWRTPPTRPATTTPAWRWPSSWMPCRRPGPR
ncbi:hypothetical protein ACU4GD_18850 [Cupriavidus basilensis]